MMICLYCGEPLDAEGLMVATHPECAIRMIAGGLNHQLGACTCHGGSAPPDPPGLSKREAARAAARHFSRRLARADA